jgi:hypothetical protein
LVLSNDREPGCWKRTAPHLGFLVGRRLHPRVSLDASLAAVAGRGGGCDYTEDVSGGVEGRYIGHTPGPSYVTTQLRAVLEPGAGTVRPRALAGVGWIPNKHVPFMVLGGGLSSGKRSTRFVADFGVQITRVEWTRRFACFGNCTAYPSNEWLEVGTSTSLQPFAKIGVEF